METTLYKITFNDGRVFKVFCANKAQKQRLRNVLAKSNDYQHVEEISNGIHNIKQWEDIISKLNK